VKVLLDTHALIWWLDDDARLSRRARRVIADARSDIYVSSASAWEMATKVRLGKLRDPSNAVRRIASILVERGMIELPITVDHASEAGSLTGDHRDPFDRMLIAQSRLEELPVVTMDPVFARYEVATVW
jgi:PIN domain nuclease of toxin-antitoxin system